MDSPVAAMSGRRTRDETLRIYRERGFVSPLRVLTPAEAARVLAEFDAWAATLPGGKPRGDFRFKPHLHLPFVNRIAHHPALVDAVSAVLETDNVLLWSSDFNAKDPGDGGYFALHQDATYAGLDPADRCVTAWLALSDPVDEEHGCMAFVEGSHHLGQLRHSEEAKERGDGDGGVRGHNMLSRGQRVDEGEFSGSSAVGECKATFVAELRGGEASLHHFHLLHKSGPNHGEKPRVGLAMRYVAASVRQTGQIRESVMLIRGVMVHDGFDLEPILPLTGEVSNESTEEGRKAHADAMRRESQNYFNGAQASGYDREPSS